MFSRNYISNKIDHAFDAIKYKIKPYLKTNANIGYNDYKEMIGKDFIYYDYVSKAKDKLDSKNNLLFDNKDYIKVNEILNEFYLRYKMIGYDDATRSIFLKIQIALHTALDIKKIRLLWYIYSFCKYFYIKKIKSFS